MSERALVVHKVESFQVPAIIAHVGPETTKRFFEFFTVAIRNANTRAAYYRAIQQFLAWAERAGIRTSKTLSPRSITGRPTDKPWGMYEFALTRSLSFTRCIGWVARSISISTTRRGRVMKNKSASWAGLIRSREAWITGWNFRSSAGRLPTTERRR
jgi:hypothetical protein